MTDEIKHPSSQVNLRHVCAAACGVADRDREQIRDLLGREDSNLQSPDPESGDRDTGAFAQSIARTLGNRNQADGAAGSAPAESGEHPAALSLEERVMVALAARGERSIANFISRAWVRHTSPNITVFSKTPDEDFVRALEREAFGK